MSIIAGNMIGSYSQLGKTFTITDENGNELIGVVTSQEQIFDATNADVKIGKTFVSDNGVGVGTDTKTYRTRVSYCLIFPGENFTIPLSSYNAYDYTKFHGVIVLYNDNYTTNANTIGVVIEDSVFSVETSEKLADISKNTETKSIDFNIVNDSENIYEIFYSTYREESEV